MGEQPDQSTLRDVQGAPSAGAFARPPTRVFLVALKIMTDDPTLEWWQALGLPDPVRWALSDTFRESVFPRVMVEEEVTRR